MSGIKVNLCLLEIIKIKHFEMVLGCKQITLSNEGANLQCYLSRYERDRTVVDDTLFIAAPIVCENFCMISVLLCSAECSCPVLQSY